MQTILSKYKKLKKPVFAIFVDFRKAFDSVCRQALFFKLAQSKATGRFYNILRDMYSNSKGQIKLAGHISKCFDINKGTEQGHPLSPDLFKHYLGGLSSLLKFKSCPQLAGLIISHLLWADDLIMLSLDEETAQKQLVNMEKTKVMITGHEPRFRPIILETLIMRYGLKGKARTRPDFFRLVLGPCAQFYPRGHIF